MTVGELGGPGDAIADLPGDTTFVIWEHPLPDGDLLNFRVYVAEPGHAVRLQVWRPEDESIEKEESLRLVHDLPYTFEQPGYKVVSPTNK